MARLNEVQLAEIMSVNSLFIKKCSILTHCFIYGKFNS